MRKLTHLLIIGCTAAAFFACTSSEDSSEDQTPSAGRKGKAGGGNGGNGGSIAGAGGVVAGAGGSIAGVGGSIAGQGGNTTAGTGGSNAGAGGSIAGVGGNTTAGVGGSTTAGTGGSTAGAGGSTSSHGPVTSLQVDPSSAVIEVVDGQSSAVAFQTKQVHQDGFVEPASDGITWTVDPPDLATVSATGLVTATGARAGAGKVTAQFQGLQATATFTVNLKYNSIDPSVPGATVTQIQGATPGAGTAPTVTYPFHETVMPQNVQAPLIQLGGSTKGVFRIKLTKPHVEVTSYVSTPSWLPLANAWRALADSDTFDPITLTVDHWDGSALSASQSITINLSPGAISGIVYYWSVEQGRIHRIDPAVGQAKPMDPKAACMACHSVSRDGRYLAVNYGNNLQGAVLDLTAADTPEVISPLGTRLTTFSTFSPDSKRLLANVATPDGQGWWTDERKLGLFDVPSGQQINTSTLPENVAQPEWSPDGKSIALISNLGENLFPLHTSYLFENGDLSVLSVQGSDTFGNMNLLHFGSSLASAPEGGNSDSHPTWSPDSSLLAFNHGVAGRASGGGPDWTAYPGALYLISASGGKPTRLDHANSGPDGIYSYWPTFSPFVTETLDRKGKYFWLAYFSHKPYAGKTIGQLWVTAIDTQPQPGKDPSHPPYWLPGQDGKTHNAAAFWTAQACRRNGENCTSASECCSEICTGTPGKCGPPDISSCRKNGETCGGASDCCNDLSCIGNTCVPGKP